MINGDNMQEANPSMLNEFGAWITALWITGISILSGFIRYYQKMDRRNAKHSFFVGVGEVAISTLVSLVSFALCDYAGLDWHYTVVVIGYASFKGTAALLKLGSIFNAIRKEI